MASERPLLIATTPGASTPDDAPSPHPPAASLLPPTQSEPPLRADRLAFSVEIPDPFRSYRRGDGPAADPSASLERERDVGDDESREVIVGESSPEFSGNAIRTAKYSFLTFLPRNLFEQFRRLSYVYFLAITVLNQLPQVAVFGRGASVLPLAFVLFVTAVKDAYEDFRRHRSDRQENNRLATVLALGTAGEFQPKRWKHIRVGDVVRIESNETLPADMVLLATSDPTGVAHVQTVNLDGETNLKTRYAKQETHVRFSQNGGVGGVLHCERPNRNIYGFQANLEIDGKRVSLGPSNIVLRGCELKNTTWAIGVVVYAGKETKVMLNSSGAPSKRSRLETQLNRETVILSIMLIGMCTTASVLAGIWLLNHRRELEFTQFFREKDYTTGKNYNYYGVGMQIFITFLMAVIVYQVIIPISLYISMELVRLGQAYFMGADKDLYDESSRSKFQCRALNINEDLGQIRYVFSDKTGTLTENKMVFQCASIRGVDYNSGKDTGGYSVVGMIT
jgi:phospholipid-transporting ATPase